MKDIILKFSWNILTYDHAKESKKQCVLEILEYFSILLPHFLQLLQIQLTAEMMVLLENSMILEIIAGDPCCM